MAHSFGPRPSRRLRAHAQAAVRGVAPVDYRLHCGEGSVEVSEPRGRSKFRQIVGDGPLVHREVCPPVTLAHAHTGARATTHTRARTHPSPLHSLKRTGARMHTQTHARALTFMHTQANEGRRAHLCICMRGRPHGARGQKMSASGNGTDQLWCTHTSTKSSPCRR